MRRVIFNEKGGVGKSSITCNLAAISAEQGMKTLIVDLDPQCNSTHYLLGQKDIHVTNTVAGYFGQTLSIYSHGTTECIHESRFSNLDIIPASEELHELQHKLESRYKIYKLRDLLLELEEEYDAIYIDTAPASNFYTRSALIASHSCLIPFDCDAFSRQALYNVIAVINEVRDDHNNELKLEAIIANQFQPRANFPRQIIQELRDEALPVAESYLSHSVKMRESHQVSKPLIYMAPNHNLTKAFLDLHNELANGRTVSAKKGSRNRAARRKKATPT